MKDYWVVAIFFFLMWFFYWTNSYLRHILEVLTKILEVV